MKVCSVCKRCFDDAVLSCENDAHPPLADSRMGGRGAIAGYTIETLVEQSARGETYRARHNGSAQTCLVRLVSAEPEAGRRFLGDAKLAAALFHANVADVYEAGELEGGTFYVVTEDSATETLRDILHTSGAPALLDSIRIIRQTAEAVHALHLKGLTHRALRPENIRLSGGEEEQVRIAGLDFGGLDELGIVSNKFMIDTAVDSIRYFAPEQCSGEGGSVRSDVYALGIILYELLAGVPPFEAPKAAALIEMHRNHRPPDIKIENFDLRMLLTHTISESLQKKASFRQCSADLFARQMRHIEQLATHVSTPPPAVIVPGTPRINFAAEKVQTAPATYNVSELTQDPQPVIVRRAEPVVSAAKSVDEVPSPRPVTEHPMPGHEIFVEAKPEPAVRRSRLKLKKKQLHSLVAAVTSVPVAAPVTPPVIRPADRIEPAEVKAAQRSAEEIHVSPAPRKIEFDLHEDDIPSMDDVLEILAREPVMPVTVAEPPMKNIVEPNKPVAPAAAIAVAVSLDADEIIDAPPVRPGIKADREKTPQRQINRAVFVPTLLGGNSNGTVSLADNSIFGTYRVPTASRLAVPYRAMAAGGGLALMASLFFFGSDSVGSLAESANGADDTVLTTAQPRAVEPPSQTVQTSFPQPLQQERLRPVKAFQEVVRETADVERVATKQTSMKPRLPVEPDPPKPIARKAAARSPMVPTTRVISTENGETKSKIIAAKNTPDRKSAQGRPAGATRPRIVQIPK